MPNLVEPIHIELPDKGAEVAMLEIFRQDDISEAIYIADVECIA